MIKVPISPSLSQWRWEFPQVANTSGAYMQGFIAAAAACATIPMVCYVHPMGDCSVMHITAMMCGSFEHVPTLVVGLALLLWLLAFYAWVLYLSCVVPSLTARGDDSIWKAASTTTQHYNQQCSQTLRPALQQAQQPALLSTTTSSTTNNAI